MSSTRHLLCTPSSQFTFKVDSSRWNVDHKNSVLTYRLPIDLVMRRKQIMWHDTPVFYNNKHMSVNAQNVDPSKTSSNLHNFSKLDNYHFILDQLFWKKIRGFPWRFPCREDQSNGHLGVFCEEGMLKHFEKSWGSQTLALLFLILKKNIPWLLHQKRRISLVWWLDVVFGREVL